MSNIKENVKDYYGKTLQNSNDLKTNACCTVEVYPPHIKEALKNIHDEVHAKYYGCGLTIPTNLEGSSVLDLGCGAGRDCYILSQLVGSEGLVVGVDMTDEQLEVAGRHKEFHRKKFSQEKSNIEFMKGEIEKLDELELSSESFDLIVSNCVINLSDNKEAVLRECFRLLKNGGEMYFSDVYADRRIPEALAKDEVLWGECLSGALYINDFLKLAKDSGFADPRSVEVHPITVSNKELEEKIGDIKFYSITYRLFKIDKLEGFQENYGHKITYRGTIKESPDQFVFDEHNQFKVNEETSVSGNTLKMIQESRLNSHFNYTGNFDYHLGSFKKETKKIEIPVSSSGGCC